ncbi:MAG: metallophosphoesterase [Elusimicrobia bacterium]|nr:metallophosphoesterase [Elusimicrobiota bacterium]
MQLHPYLRFGLFLAAALSIYLGVHYYLASWTARHFANLGATPAATRLAFWAIALLTVSAMLLNRAHPSDAARLTVYWAYVAIGVIFLWVSYVVMADLLETGLRLLYPGLDTAQFFGILVLALTAASAIWAVFDARKPPAFKHMELTVDSLPTELDGFTVVQLSDIHLSHTVHIEQVRETFARLASLEPDVYLFTGDVIDPGFPEEAEFQRICSGLKSRYGSYGVLGNHEYYYGVGKALRFYEKSGIRPLRQETITLPCGMQLSGIDDIRESRMRMEELDQALSKLDRNKPSIFLAHQPKQFERVAQAGASLILSGHTHDGQVFPFNLFVKLAFPKYYYGLHRLENTWIYITSGTFYWGPPMRFFSRSEIPVIKLRCGKKA